ncbi:MAG: hypothetical protein JWP55_1047, partial [Mycobacterium sp.]|nr:hypothetical protein [Mycobacterium sp.]
MSWIRRFGTRSTFSTALVTAMASVLGGDGARPIRQRIRRSRLRWAPCCLSAEPGGL